MKATIGSCVATFVVLSTLCVADHRNSAEERQNEHSSIHKRISPLAACYSGFDEHKSEEEDLQRSGFLRIRTSPIRDGLVSMKENGYFSTWASVRLTIDDAYSSKTR